MLKKVKELPLSGWHKSGVFNEGEETAGALFYEFEDSTISFYYTSARWEDFCYETPDPGFGGFASYYPTRGVDVDARLIWKEKDGQYKSTWIPISGGRQRLVCSPGSRGNILFDSSGVCHGTYLKDTFKLIWSQLSKFEEARNK